MKRNPLIYIAFLLSVIVVSCDKNFDEIDTSQSKTGNPTSVESITSKALPGEILLEWNVPKDSSYHYVQVGYYDHLTEKDEYKVASVYCDTMLIENTRAKFGEYKFTFQTFNSKGKGGEKQTFSAVSGKAPATETITATEIALKAEMLSTNSQEPREGPIANLIDGDSGSFFHTIWSTTKVDFPLYVQVDLDKPIKNFKFYFQNRAWSQVGGNHVQVQISTDGTNWETISEIKAGLPSGGGAEYTSDVFRPSHNFSHFRYNVVSTYNNKSYFNMAELKLYDVEIEVYDPEL